MGIASIASTQLPPPASTWAMVFSNDMGSGMTLAAADQSVVPSKDPRISWSPSSSSGVVKHTYVLTAPSMSPLTSLSPTRCVTGLTTPNLWTPK